MPKRVSIKLGVGGEFVRPGANMRARWLFLEAVCRDVPEAMTALAAIAKDLPEGQPSNSMKFQQEAPLRAWARQWGFTAPERP